MRGGVGQLRCIIGVLDSIVPLRTFNRLVLLLTPLLVPCMVDMCFHASLDHLSMGS